MRARPLYIALLSIITSFTVFGQVPPCADTLPCVDEATMKAKFAEMDLQQLEGVWEYPAEEMKLAIERHSGEKGIAYRIVLLASSDLELLPGAVVGYVARSADPSKFRLWLYTERSGISLQSPMECVATLSKDCTSLTFEPPHIKVKVRLNLARIFTKVFRGVSVMPEKVEEALPVGFHKVFPANGNGEKFNEIRYL